jgi:hypothetical protein
MRLGNWRDQDPGSKRTRRRRKHAPNVCGCWYCTPGRTKRRLLTGPRSAIKRDLRAELTKEDETHGR